MTKAISTELTPANREAVARLLAEAPERFERALRGLPPERLAAPLGPGQRSPAQVLAHVLHCEARTTEAIVQALLVREPLLPAIHPERHLGQLLRLDRLAPADLLAYFRLRRVVLMGALGGLTDRQWARTVRQPGKQRQESVYWQARGQALHEQDHLAELERGRR
jgi:hypothetical protein